MLRGREVETRTNIEPWNDVFETSVESWEKAFVTHRNVT